MKIAEKTDYSFLFDSLNSSNKNSTTNIFDAIDLSEYHSIKSGNYGKLLKQYYAQINEDSETQKTTTTKNTQEDTAVKKLTEVSTNASSLSDSADKLITKGTDSLFKEKELSVTDEKGNTTTVEGYDTEAIYNAVSDFTSKYNAFLKSLKNSDSDKVEAQVDGLTKTVADYTQSLNAIGISVNEDNTLSINADTFKASDMNEVKKLFNGNTSFAYVVSTKSSFIGTTANSEANTMKTYTNAGDYDNSFSSGNILDSLI